MKVFYTTDSLPNNFVALNIIQNKRIDFNNLKNDIINRGLIDIGTFNKEGNYYPKTPVIVGILTVPSFYLLNYYYGTDKLNTNVFFMNEFGQYIGKITASLYCAFSAVLLFLILLKLKFGLKQSLFFTFIYVFCTSVFNTASQANWQHGYSLFFINLFLLLFIAFPKRSFYLLLCGLVAGLFTQIRISNFFYIFFIPTYLLLLSSLKIKQKLKMVIMLGLGLIISYACIYILNLLIKAPNGYMSEIYTTIKEWNFFLFVKNLISILFSFNYGLFFYSPILLLSLLVFINKPYRKIDHSNIVFLSLVPTLLLFLIFASSWWMWTGGKSMNARLLLETNPAWIILLAYSFTKFNKFLVYRIIFAIFMIISIYVNMLTTFGMDFSWYDSFQYKRGSNNQLWMAWSARPILLLHLIKRNYIHITKIRRIDNQLLVRNTVYRPSFKYKGVIKLFDKEELLLKLK